MHRILVLDSDTPLRARLIEAVHRIVNTDAMVVADEHELISKMKLGAYAAVFVDADLLEEGPSRLIEGVRTATVRPMVVIASNEKREDLDPDLVTMVVHKPYDVLTVTGILLSAIAQVPPPSGQAHDSTPAG